MQSAHVLLGAGNKESRLGRNESAGLGCADRMPRGNTRVAIQTAGQIDGQLRRGVAFSWSITASKGGRGSPRAPVPNNPSTIHAASAKRLARRIGSWRLPKFSIGTVVFCRILKFTSASPVNSFASAQRSTRTAWPRMSKCLAMTKPSPALLPLPQQIATGPARPNPQSTSATPRPAFSINTKPERPNSSAAKRSTWRDSWRFRVIAFMDNLSIFITKTRKTESTKTMAVSVFRAFAVSLFRDKLYRLLAINKVSVGRMIT